MLYAPADNPELMEKTAATEADAVIFDLEDAVREERKPTARETLREVLADVDFGEKELCVRVNGLDTDHWHADVRAAVDAGVHTISLPKVERPWEVRAAVSVAGAIADDPPEFIVILESPRGVFAGPAIAQACAALPPVTGLTFGVGDYARATGGSPTSTEIRSFLNHRVVAFAAMGGLVPVSSVYPDVTDDAALRQVAETARELGFVGQSVIHPKQVAIANDVFTPAEEEVERARSLLRAFEETDRGAVVVDGVFLDEALADRYRAVVARYDAVHGA